MKETVDRFWNDLYARDWDALAAHFADDCEYTDMCTPAEDVAHGPAQIVARIRVGFDPLEKISDTDRRIYQDGDVCVVEHVEHWDWPTGERASLPFVSVQEFRAGKLARWYDYWDLATLMNNAPAWWVEHIMTESAKLGLQ
jgi:ketosteroid isomerase-like protein